MPKAASVEKKPAEVDGGPEKQGSTHQDSGEQDECKQGKNQKYDETSLAPAVGRGQQV